MLCRWRWALLFLAVLATRLCHLDILWVEEAYPLAAAREVLRGKTLFRDIWFDKPPLFAAFYLLDGSLAGWPLRLLGTLFVVFSAWVLYRAACSQWGEREATLAAFLCAFYLTFDFPSAVIALTPDLLALPLHAAAVALAISGQPFLSGLCAGCALLLNTKAILIFAACLLWQWRALPSVLAGFLVPVSLQLAWLFYRGAVSHYVEQVWQWGAGYSRDTPFDRPWNEGARRAANWSGFHAALLLASAYALTRREKDTLRWLAWIALSAGAVALGLRFFPRYWFHLLPVLLLLAARGFALLPRKAAVAVALLLLIPFARFGARHASLGLDLLMNRSHEWRDLAMHSSSRAAAAKLRSLALPSDTLLVWGYRPDVFVLSNLSAASRFLDSQPLNGVIADRHLTSSQPTFPAIARRNQQELLRSPRPSFILDGLGTYNPQLDIRQALPELLSEYRLVGEGPGWRLYQHAK